MISLFWYWAGENNQANKDMVYCFLMDSSLADGKIRRMLRNKISKQLPHGFEEEISVKKKIISEFMILSMAEWTERYSEYQITKVK